MTTRRAKLTPWYHVQLPRCTMQTQHDTQCLFTATFEVLGTLHRFCKTHADMVITQKTFRRGKVKRIPESMVIL